MWTIDHGVRGARRRARPRRARPRRRASASARRRGEAPLGVDGGGRRVEVDAAQHRDGRREQGPGGREVEARNGARDACARSRASGGRARRGGARRRRCAGAPASSAGFESVLNGTATAPIRAAASQATTKSGPFGNSRPTWAARADARGEQRAREARGAALGVAVRERRRVADHEDRARRARRALAQEPGDRERQRVAGVDERASAAGRVDRAALIARGEDTAGSAARSPATAGIVAVAHSASPAKRPRDGLDAPVRRPCARSRSAAA